MVRLISLTAALALAACNVPNNSVVNPDKGSDNKNVNYKLNSSNTDVMTLDELSRLLKDAHGRGEEAVKGYGKSVFFGTKPVRFDIEVVDIIKDFIGEGYDVIFFRFDSPFIQRDDSSIVAGMSGSPLYVNDKCIGALAYGYPWGRINNKIGYATPIEYMLQELETKSIKPPQGTATAGNNNVNGVRTFMPMYISGGVDNNFNKRVAAFNQKYPDNPFAQYEFVGSSSESMVFADSVPETVEAGSVLGVQLVGGDLNWAGVGTATYVKDNKVLAFGHPMFGSGTKYKMPMTTGHISGIVALFPRCWKQGAAYKEIGTLNFDGISSINGTMGEFTKKVAVQYNLNNQMTGQKKTVNLTMCNAKDFIPYLVWMTVFESYGSMLTAPEKPLLLRANVEGKLNDGSSFSFNFEEFSSDAMFMEWPLYMNLSAISSNKFNDKIEYDSITVNYDFIPNSTYACISSIWTDKQEINEPGEEITLKVLLSVKDKPGCGSSSGGGFGGGG